MTELEFPSLIKQIAATGHISFSLSEAGKVYTWPVGGTDKINPTHPFEIPIN